MGNSSDFLIARSANSSHVLLVFAEALNLLDFYFAAAAVDANTLRNNSNEEFNISTLNSSKTFNIVIRSCFIIFVRGDRNSSFIYRINNNSIMFLEQSAVLKSACLYVLELRAVDEIN